VSRIGKLPVKIPAGVEAKLEGEDVVVKGPKGLLRQRLTKEVKLEFGDGELKCHPTSETKKSRSQWGLYRVLLNNMMTGVSQGFTKKLEIIGVGYRAEMKGKDLNLHLGYSHPVLFAAPEGIEFGVDSPTKINVSGIDKQQVGQIAADVRKIRPPEPYKGKGVRYAGEEVRRKAGKAGAK
jgi:large subunit ribosomal protein L6